MLQWRAFNCHQRSPESSRGHEFSSFNFKTFLHEDLQFLNFNGSSELKNLIHEKPLATLKRQMSLVLGQKKNTVYQYQLPTYWTIEHN